MDTQQEQQFGKPIIRFGDWIVTHQGILHMDPEYFIPNKELWTPWKDTVHDKWEWPIHVAEKRWTDVLGLYEFNMAFLYAQELFREFRPLNLPTVSWCRTLETQKGEFERRQGYRKTESQD